MSSLDQLDVRTATSMQTYDFSTLYTSIPHKLLKSRIAGLVHNSFKKRDESNCYTHITVGRRKEYFFNSTNSREGNMYAADQVCSMIDFLVYNIFVKFGRYLFRQVIGIPW